ASITSLIVTIWPCFIRILMTSTARSAMRLASSWMVIASGIVTSRTSFSFGSLLRSPVRRCTRRRNDASERSRTSSAVMAVTSVRRRRGPSVARFAPRVARRLGAGLRRAGRALRRGGRAHRAAGAAADHARAFGFFFRFELRAHARRFRRGLAFAEALLGDLVGLLLGFVVVLAALVFLALARFGGLALGPFDG